MKQTKCLECDGKITYNEDMINKPLWCDMNCKKKFLLNNYNFNQAKLWFIASQKEFKIRQKKVLKEIKESGLTATEFLYSLSGVEE